MKELGPFFWCVRHIFTQHEGGVNLDFNCGCININQHANWGQVCTNWLYCSLFQSMFWNSLNEVTEERDLYVSVISLWILWEKSPLAKINTYVLVTTMHLNSVFILAVFLAKSQTTWSVHLKTVWLNPQIPG